MKKEKAKGRGIRDKESRCKDRLRRNQYIFYVNTPTTRFWRAIGNVGGIHT